MFDWVDKLRKETTVFLIHSKQKHIIAHQEPKQILNPNRIDLTDYQDDKINWLTPLY